MEKLICVALICVSAIYAEDGPTVSLEDGLVKGRYEMSFDGRQFSAFEGIPYAQPPIGDLRFADPQPAIPWEGTLEANTTYRCLQLEFGAINIIGQEDCLYLNVYVPLKTINSDNLDVIVHLHGGAFMTMAPQDIAGPHKLMDRDVVYVSMNYRLAALGFLSSGDEVIPGNYGMKDQTFALKWVQRNIEKFGGNPNSVTINGVSAGGGSTSLHYLSPLSKGLFHRGIAGSGLSSAPWAIRKDPWATGKRFAEEVGCSDLSKEAVLRCLREKPALQLQEAVKAVYQRADLLMPVVLFGPVVEPDLPTSFLIKDPHIQLREEVVSDVPLMAIMDSAEGTVPSVFHLQQLQEINDNLDSYLPYILEYDLKEENEQKEITRKVKLHYWNNEPIIAENFVNFVKACTDRLFHGSIQDSVRQQASISNSEVYFLFMAYAGEKGMLDIPGAGVGHGADGKYYYTGKYVPNDPIIGDEKILQENLLDMFVNFAKTGKATIKGVDFEPVSKEGDLRYLVVRGPKDIEMASDNNFGDIKFWHWLGLE